MSRSQPMAISASEFCTIQSASGEADRAEEHGLRGCNRVDIRLDRRAEDDMSVHARQLGNADVQWTEEGLLRSRLHHPIGFPLLACHPPHHPGHQVVRGDLQRQRVTWLARIVSWPCNNG